LPLSDDRLEALRNLSQKKAGLIVGWIDIAEARALTELGFAERASSGWLITAEGEAALAQAAPVGTGNVTPSKR
jgi:anti-sigma factor RsiW